MIYYIQPKPFTIFSGDNIGLDMWLEASPVILYNDKRNKKVKEIFPEFAKRYLNENHPEEMEYGIDIYFEVGTWRKANAIHGWFVENVQKGIDDCGRYSVNREQLKELLELCRKVKENPKKAPDLLPTQTGFFFGGTEYDEWYFRNIDRTIDIIEKALTLPDDYCFYYISSW